MEELTEMVIDLVSTLVFFIKPAIFPINPSAGQLNNSHIIHSSAGLKK